MQNPVSSHHTIDLNARAYLHPLEARHGLKKTGPTSECSNCTKTRAFYEFLFFKASLTIIFFSPFDMIFFLLLLFCERAFTRFALSSPGLAIERQAGAEAL